jgi:hypothetical protein
MTALHTDYCINLKNGAFDGTTRADLDRLFEQFTASAQNTHLVVHFHGGLVGKQDGAALAGRLADEYIKANAYPVFFVWESGWNEVVGHNVAEIFREDIFQRLLKRVTQFALGKLSQGEDTRGLGLELPGEFEVENELESAAAGREPYAGVQSSLPPGEELTAEEAEQFRTALEEDAVLQEEAASIESALAGPDAETTRGIGGAAPKTTLISPEVLAEMRATSGEEGERSILAGVMARVVKGGVVILSRVVRRFAEKHDHGLYKTVFEEILREFYIANAGQVLWKHMKKDTADAFGKDPEFHGGTAFLTGLAGILRNGTRPRVTLIGHSTGAVYICHFLKHADEVLPPDFRFDIVFLAAAADFELVSKTLEAHGSRVNRMRCFGMSDERERANALIDRLPHVYPSSLLYFVSGVLEEESDKPLVGMQRYFSGTEPYTDDRFPQIASVRRFLDRHPHSRIWSQCTDGDGFNCDSATHGDFDNDPKTLASVRHVLAHGY